MGKLSHDGSTGRAAAVSQRLPWPAGVEQAVQTGPFFRLVDRSEGALLSQDLDRFLIMLTGWITGLRILVRLENSDAKHLLRQHIDDAIGEIDHEGARA